ncbi:MAG: RCC1 domain-containing protein [Kofleriaceae bacterium]
MGLDTEDRSTTWTSIRDAVSGQPITDAIAIGTGGDHACAIRDDTSVWCWGRNNHGHLGNSSTTDSAVAVQVTMLSNSMPLLGAVTVGAGRDHTCAITSSSGVWCWGLNDVGQLGDGSAAPEQHQAVAVQSSAGGALGGVTEISVGRDHTCATTANDEVWCWGANDYGQLANDSPMGFHATAVAIGTWRSVAAGQPDYTCMVDSANHAWCAGSSFRQRLGNGAHTTEEAIPERYATPQPVLAAHDGTQLGEVAKAVAGSASCALMIDHTVRCWGSNNHGQVGTGIGTGYPLPVIFQDGTPLTDVVELTAGYSHTCARTSAGALLCWGRGTDGELADGSLTEHGFPTPITAPSCP